jgi:hypothetical protein
MHRRTWGASSFWIVPHSSPPSLFGEVWMMSGYRGTPRIVWRSGASAVEPLAIMGRDYFDPTPEEQHIVLVAVTTLRKARFIESCETAILMWPRYLSITSWIESQDQTRA